MSIYVFAGTSEGRALAAFLEERQIRATLFVATDYGKAVLPPMQYVLVREGRLDATEMAQTLEAGALVVDATHPYAVAVTANIQRACAETHAEYVRLLRPTVDVEGKHIAVLSVADAVHTLNDTTGSILLTTGSKDLAAFTRVRDFASRIWVRMLPEPNMLGRVLALGYQPAHIIAMQGPFSEEMNLALLRQTGAQYVVTKDSGHAGGFAEKAVAAQKAGATLLIIGRPSAEVGLSLSQVQARILARLPAKTPEHAPLFPLFVSLAGKRVLIVGAGNIAAGRAQKLQPYGAHLTVVATQQRDMSIAVTHVRAYRTADVEGMFLVLAATDDAAVNRQIAQDCAARGIFCSVCTDADAGSFYFPALARGETLSAGVVSDGHAHHLVKQAAQTLRRVIHETEEEAKNT